MQKKHKRNHTCETDINYILSTIDFIIEYPSSNLPFRMIDMKGHKAHNHPFPWRILNVPLTKIGGYTHSEITLMSIAPVRLFRAREQRSKNITPEEIAKYLRTLPKDQRERICAVQPCGSILKIIDENNCHCSMDIKLFAWQKRY